MKLVTFLHESIQKIGAVVDDQIIDFSTSHLPKSMIEFIELGDDGINQANALIAKNDSKISINDVKLMAPIPKPNKILGVGLNYKAHKEEAAKAAADLLGKPQEKYPTIFNKQNSSVVGPYDDMHKPDASDFFDYEGELGFVIGKQCRHVPYDKASSVIYGYTVVNDATIRDWQMRGPPMTMTMGKSWDTHCPFGPYLVTSDEVGNPHQLKLETHVNGELRQSASTDGLIHDCFTVVEYLSTAFTLEPGDLIATGTPEGVAATSRNWLKVDDVVKVTIEKLGFIENKVIAEPDSTASY
ncbi:MAG: fumarylacetoacetate hydrolase family protein [Candidatus Pelagibacterales bacterium]|jgi:2-keto-4-pentenoate hydratase/2-oxohepta-3-ene-1,7-dioic acid hydratase in catechol pathway|tara:strand:- start:134 stop:1027 length:894 start_codon:yes stop_codon:yes gene_type:complete